MIVTLQITMLPVILLLQIWLPLIFFSETGYCVNQRKTDIFMKSAIDTLYFLSAAIFPGFSLGYTPATPKYVPFFNVQVNPRWFPLFSGSLTLSLSNTTMGNNIKNVGSSLFSTSQTDSAVLKHIFLITGAQLTVHSWVCCRNIILFLCIFVIITNIQNQECQTLQNQSFPVI